MHILTRPRHFTSDEGLDCNFSWLCLFFNWKTQMWTINLLSTVHFPTTKNLPRWDSKQFLFKILFDRMAPDGRQLLSEPVKWKNDLAPRRFIPLRDLSRVIEESLERRRRVEEILARRNLLSVGSPSISPVVSQTQIDSPETRAGNGARASLGARFFCAWAQARALEEKHIASERKIWRSIFLGAARTPNERGAARPSFWISHWGEKRILGAFRQGAAHRSVRSERSALGRSAPRLFTMSATKKKQQRRSKKLGAENLALILRARHFQPCPGDVKK